MSPPGTASIGWIFFDAGNTLIGLNETLLLRELEEEGLKITEQDLHRAQAPARIDLDRRILDRWLTGAVPRTGWIEGSVWNDFWREVLAACGARAAKMETLIRTVDRVVRPAASWDRVDPKTAPLLQRLRSRGYRLGVISNSSGTLVEHLERIGLLNHFEVTIDSHEVGVEKPHKEIFRMAMRETGCDDPSRALYVGDVYAIDVVGARGAGMQAVLFDPRGWWNPGAIQDQPPCPTIRSLVEVESILD